MDLRKIISQVVSQRVAKAWDNRVSDDEFDELEELISSAIGIDAITKILSERGIDLVKNLGLRDIRKHELQYTGIPVPIGDVELVMDAGDPKSVRGHLKRRSVPRHILLKEPQALGYTSDPEMVASSKRY